MMSSIIDGKFYDQTLFGLQDILFGIEDFAYALTLAKALHDVVTYASMFHWSANSSGVWSGGLSTSGYWMA